MQKNHNIPSHFRTWKKGKSWLYTASLLTALLGGAYLGQTAKADSSPDPVISQTTTSPMSSSLSTGSTDPEVIPSDSSATLTTLDQTESDSSLPVNTSTAPSDSVNSAAASVVNGSDLSTEVIVTDPSLPLVDNSTITSDYPDLPNTATLTSTTTEEFYTIAYSVMYLEASFAAYSGVNQLKVGDTFTTHTDGTGQVYQIIDAVNSYDPSFGYPPNGMQVMAVSPVINGVVDTSRIIISYAATNFQDLTDWVTDLETVVGGSSIYQPLDGSASMPSQFVTAVQYANTLIAKYPTASFAHTGISLGGFLSQAVGAVEHQPVVAFVGPSATSVLTDEQIAYVQAHPDLYFNVRNAWDLVLGAYGGNELGDAHYYNQGYAQLPAETVASILGPVLTPLLGTALTPVLSLLVAPISGHTPSYSFNPDGSLASPGAQDMGTLLNLLTPENLFSFILSPLAGALTLAIPGVASIISSISSALAPVTNAINTVANPIVNTVVSVTNGVVSAVTTVTDPIANAVTSTVTTVVNTATSVVNSTVSTVTNGVTSVVNQVTSWFHL